MEWLKRNLRTHNQQKQDPSSNTNTDTNKTQDTPKTENTPIPPRPDEEILQAVEQTVNLDHEKVVANINTNIGKKTAKRKGRLEITGPDEVIQRFKSKCVDDGKIPSRVMMAWIKAYLAMFVIIGCTFGADKSYTTQEILEYIAPQTLLLDLKLSAKASGGYGTPEMYESPAKTNMKTGLFLEWNLLSTAERKERQMVLFEKRADALNELADIAHRSDLLSFLNSQLSATQKKKKWIEQRISTGIAKHTEIYPVENHLIEIRTKIQAEKAAITKAQLKIAGLAGAKWEELFESVKKWDKKL